MPPATGHVAGSARASGQTPGGARASGQTPGGVGGSSQAAGGAGANAAQGSATVLRFAITDFYAPSSERPHIIDRDLGVCYRAVQGEMGDVNYAVELEEIDTKLNMGVLGTALYFFPSHIVTKSRLR